MAKHITSAKSFWLLAAVVVILGASRCAAGGQPNATNASRLRPSELLAQAPAKPAPRLAGTGAAARRAVQDFLAWAGASTTAQREEGRREIAAAADNRDIVQALCDEITAARTRDHSRALLGLSVLGEMRSPHALGYLRDFVHLPLPPAGERLIEGEDPAQTALATLQAKAVGGLAYMNTAESNREVFWAVGQHASRIVRAEAIRTYLMNHDNSAAARDALRPYVRKGEENFLDRPNRDPGDGASAFNRKLDDYLRAHPDLLPPQPERGSADSRPGRAYNFDRPVPRF
jgi:hypothetical protein